LQRLRHDAFEALWLRPEAALKYMKFEAPKLTSSDILAWHIELRDPFIGELTLEEVHDETLLPFKETR